MRVEDLMTRDCAQVRPVESLAHAARQMRLRDCGCVVVVDERSHVMGLLTDRDVCMAALRTDRPLTSLEVRSAMSPLVFGCRRQDTIAEAERQMDRYQLRRLPVLDESGRLEGILSIADIAREARRGEDLIALPVTVREVGQTLGQIGRPTLGES